MKALGYHLTPQGVQYVCEVPGPSSGWGFTRHRDAAFPMTPYWQKRFAARCNAKGSPALFIALRISTNNRGEQHDNAAAAA